MEQEPSHTPAPTLQEVLIELRALSEQVQQEGSVDTEQDLLRDIENKLQAGELEPSEAMQKARDIIASRQDYH